MTRASKSYASAYDRSRIQVSRVQRQEKREYIVDFAAVIGDESISSVTWRCNSPEILYMTSGAIAGKTVSVVVNCQLGGVGSLKATITTSGGSIYSQVFDVQVRDCPSFPDDNTPTSGPFSLTVDA